ncbi:MAG TPA: MarR family winged helix-turn-helix transcriptional regulator [Anaerolineales bacterium]|nr:MarR family winged helix-turn-helix transcriptional regulator [Anaerolineales bacterium]
MPPSSKLLLHADRIQRATYELVRAYALCDRVCGEQIGITAAQGYTLLALSSPESVSMNDLSQTMQLAISTMTRMVDQLVLKKLVERVPDPDDRRVVRVRLTRKGHEVQAKLREALREIFAEVVRSLPDGQQETIVQGLEVLNNAFTDAIKACCAIGEEA